MDFTPEQILALKGAGVIGGVIMGYLVFREIMKTIRTYWATHERKDEDSSSG
jgi:hypothetical protein